MGFTYPGYRTNFRANNFGLQLVPHNNAMEDWKLLLTADQRGESNLKIHSILPIQSSSYSKMVIKRRIYSIVCTVLMVFEMNLKCTLEISSKFNQ